MNQFWTFVIKEFRHILRDPRTLLVLLGIPVIQILLFGFALTNEVKNSRFAVLDQDRTPETRAIIERMSASRYFDLRAYLDRPEQIEEGFRAGHYTLAVVFPVGFSSDLFQAHDGQIQLIADGSDPNLGNSLLQYAGQIIHDHQLELFGNRNLPYTIETRVRMLYNPQQKGAFNFVPGVMAMVMMLICAMMTSISIVREKEHGNMEVLLVSPLRPMVLILAKLVPYLVLSLVNLTSILGLSVFLLDLPIAGSLLLLYAVSGLFILTALALGMLISTSTESQMTAMFISLVGLMLPTLMFSGFMFPIENMPIPLQAISNLVPARWFYVIVKDVMIKGLGFGAIWKETLILTGMTVFLLVVSWRKFNIRLT